MKVVILSSLGNDTAQRCTSSLFETAAEADFDVHVFRERGFREQTLNHALQQVGIGEDILFVGDDIVFSDGWHQALINKLDQADILGMTMLYPGTSKIQDRGYDLMGEDGKAALVAKDRGLKKDSPEPFEFRFCDAVCGCFLYIKAEVFAHVDSFSEQGQNRWGEFIFIAQARKAGFTCGVIEHYLQHGGISTKNNPDQKLSSTSYLVEHGWWDEIVRDHVDPQWIKKSPKSHLDISLAQLLTPPGNRILFYGGGTVAQFILNQTGENLKAHLDFCSGLKEEVGLEFMGHTLQDAATIDTTKFDTILMTPLRIGEGLFYKILAPRLTADFQGQVFVVETRQKNQMKEFWAREIPVQA